MQLFLYPWVFFFFLLIYFNRNLQSPAHRRAFRWYGKDCGHTKYESNLENAMVTSVVVILDSRMLHLHTQKMNNHAFLNFFPIQHIHRPQKSLLWNLWSTQDKLVFPKKKMNFSLQFFLLHVWWSEIELMTICLKCSNLLLPPLLIILFLDTFRMILN